MRIAISTLTTTKQALGVGRYIASLLDALQKIDHENEYLIYTSQDNFTLFNLQADNFQEIRTGFTHSPRIVMRPAYFAWQNSWFTGALRRRGVDVLHLPNLLPLLWSSVPTVVTIHDLGEYKVSQKYGAARLWYRQRILPVTVHNAARVIAVSESTKRDLIEILKAPADKIDVTYEGVSDRLTLDATASARCPDQIQAFVMEPYILYAGAMHVHKNLARLIEAFHLCKTENGLPHKLVISGRNIGEYERLRALITELELDEAVRFTGYVSDQMLACLYQQADLFAYIPLNEGFGLPVLEAMSAGIPVLASDASSIPEVAGDAAVLVDPLNVRAIADGMQTILTDPGVRERLGKRGIEQAKRFSWERCAALTLESYQQAVGNVS